MCAICQTGAAGPGLFIASDEAPRAPSVRQVRENTWLDRFDRNFGDDTPGNRGPIWVNPDAEAAIGNAVNVFVGTGNLAVDALIAGTKWNMGTIPFSFPTSPSDYPGNYGSDEPTTGFAPLSIEFQQAVRYILTGDSAQAGGFAFTYGSVASFTNVGFTETTGSAGVIKVAYSTVPNVAWGYYPWGDEEGGDIWFNPDYMGARTAPQVGDYAWLTTIHELGHTLGLKHGHESSGGLTGVGAVPASMDSLEYTVMTYRSYVGHDAQSYDNETWGYPQTFMMLDIAALQHLYGADFTVNATDTTYKWNPNTGEMSINGVGQGAPGGNRVFLTIWDGGGNDTYDLSSYIGNQVIVDLAPGGYSLTSLTQRAYLGDSISARGNVFNALLYQGDTRSLIENAIGTMWGDTISGNIAANRLEGRDAGDILDGREGDDILVGGKHNDTLTGGAGADLFRYNNGDGEDVITDFEDGTDLIEMQGYNGYTLAQEGSDTRIIFGPAASILLKNVAMNTISDADFFVDPNPAWDQTLLGTSENDMLSGEGGRDLIRGLAGDDQLFGLGGADQLEGGDGNDILDGGSGGMIGDTIKDVLLGEAGDDDLRGAVGDRIDGGSGTDRVTLAMAEIVENSTFDISAAAAGVSQTFAWNGQLVNVESILLYGGLGVETVTGGALADEMQGFGGDDVLAGGGGADLLVGGFGSDSLSGGDGDDTLHGDGATTVTDNADTLDGGAGNDLLRGNAGDDTLIGGAGDDALQGDGGNDHLDGGAGIDLADYSASGGPTTVSLAITTAQNTGDAGIDTLVGIENLTGSNSDDTLTGSAGSNVISGGMGADRIRGGGGADTLEGGTGDDVFVFAVGDGVDVVTDFVAGGAEDRIEVSGYTGYTKVQEGGDLRIVFDGSHSILLKNVTAASFTTADINIPLAPPVITGTNAGETLTGTENAETINALGGNDSLIGLGGNDILNGEEGNDRLVGGAGNDALNGGAGVDQADYRQAAAGVTVDLAAGTASGEGADTLSSVENVQGSAFADAISGDSAANSLNGHAGNDILTGNEGNDTLVGGAGADLLNGGGGLDYASYISATAGVGVNLLNNLNTGDAAGDVFNLIERFRLSAFADTFQGAAGTNYAYGAEGNDVLRGGAGFDRLYGEEGNDSLFGEADNDVLIGGQGADAIDGGGGKDGASYETAAAAVTLNLATGTHTGDAAGDAFTSVEFFMLSAHNDTFVGGAAADEAQGGNGLDTLSGGDGADWMRGQAGNDVLNGDAGDDVLEGGAGADQLNGGAGTDYASYYQAAGINLASGVHTGEAAGDTFTSVERFRLSGYDDSFFGSAGNDWVAGYMGNDTLNGADGDDTLNGGGSSDTLIGGNGNDKLIGEAGNDTLTGGAGSDAFQYTAPAFGNDVVTDFQNGADYIRVTGIAGVDDFSDLTVSQDGANAVITFPDGSTITLNGVSAATVDAADFSFG